MADDIMIEVTGSAKTAESALDRVTKKLETLKETFDRLAPSVKEFTDRMNSIASSSKAISSLKKITESTQRSALSAKDAESKMAMYQARLDRATLSMNKTRVASERLAAAQRKLNQASGIDAANQAFLNSFKYKGSSGVASSYLPTPDTTPSVTPFPGSSRLASSIVDAQSTAQKATFNINTTPALTKLQEVQAYIDSLTPSITEMSSKAQADFQGMATKLTTIAQQIDNQRAMWSKLASAQGQAASKFGENSNQALKLEKQMLSADSAIGRLIDKQDKLKTQMSQITDASKKTSAGFWSFGKAGEDSAKKSVNGMTKLLRMVKSVAISLLTFKALTAIQQGFKTGIQNIAQASSEANYYLSAIASSSLYMKNSLGAALMPVIQALTPYITGFTDALANLFNTIGMLTARIFNGATSVTIAKKANVDYAASLGKSNTAAKELQRTIAGFDEINTLSNPSSDSATSAAAGMPDVKTMFETVQIPEWVNNVGKIADKVKTALSDITAIVSGFALAVGAILLLTGANIPLGLGLMAIGAIGLASTISANWGNMTTPLLNTLTTITAAVGGFTLALGAILALSGANIPLGIGLMVVGAASLAASIGITWGSLKADVSTVMSAITGVVSGAALALGALFALTGVDVPLGIGLMLVGAIGLASAVALNWSGISNDTKESLSTITAIVSGSMLALGAMLTLTGVAPALGIPMMAVGAASLATTIAVNWNSMSTQLKSTLTAVTTVVGTSLLALGAVIAFSGVGLPLGIGLMAVGAASLATAASLNWNVVKEQIKTVLADILAIISVASVAIGLMLCLTGAGIPLGIGLIMAGMAGTTKAQSISANPLTNWAKSAVNGVIDVFETGVNYIISMINKISLTVPDWVVGIGGQTFGFDIQKIHVPRLATGGLVSSSTLAYVGEGHDQEAVIPLNNDVFSNLAQGIVDNGGIGGNSTDADRIIERLDSLEDAIRNMKMVLVANNREIAESANAGNRLLDRARHSIAST